MIRREIDFTNLRRICMSKELKMEVFASKEPVKSVRLHVYEFHTSELYENKYRLIRSAAWKIRNVNACGVFEDGSYIYTTEKISEEIPNVNFRLTYLGEQELGVLEHKKVYSELIKHSEEVIVKHMHICVFPLDIGSVVFAFYNKADTEYDSFVNQFNELDDDEKMRIISYIIYEYSEDMLTAKKFPHRTWFLNKMEVTFRETTEIFALSKEMAQEMQREKVKALQNIEKDFPCILSEKFAVKK